MHEMIVISGPITSDRRMYSLGNANAECWCYSQDNQNTSPGFQKYKSNEYEMIVVGGPTTSAHTMCCTGDANTECWCCWQDTKTWHLVSRNISPASMKWSQLVGRRWVLAECVSREMCTGVVDKRQKYTTGYLEIQDSRAWNDRTQWVDDECSQHVFPGDANTEC